MTGGSSGRLVPLRLNGVRRFARPIGYGIVACRWDRVVEEEGMSAHDCAHRRSGGGAEYPFRHGSGHLHLLVPPRRRGQGALFGK
jgi:hypothetical protein